MATIKEIAALAGVSRGTVDRVLNHRGDVNPQTEEKIMKIVRALDYKPNKAGIVLAAQKKNLKLGVVLLGVGNPFFDDVLAGVREKAEELAGYNCSVLIKQTEYSLQQQLHAIDALLAEGREKDVIAAIIRPEGLNYGNLPKGLLTFHHAGDGTRTPVEEQLMEGAQSARQADGTVKIPEVLWPYMGGTKVLTPKKK